MKKSILSGVFTFATVALMAQGQIANSDFEQWETPSGSPNDEPVNWNSFMTASGGFTWAADNQLLPSTDVRPGSAGTTSARIWTRSAGFGIKANGNLTLGRINMGAATADAPDDNYNYTITSDPDFSQALTDAPDSIVFWAKYTAANGGSTARMKATLHDDYDYHDPEGTGGSAAHGVAYAELDYSPTNGWQRFAVAFDYSGPASVNTYILVTFASNSIPGGGDVDDEVIIDDVELIYNSNSITDLKNSVFVGLDNVSNTLSFNGFEGTSGTYEVYSTAGVLVQSGAMQNTVPFNEEAGMYVIKTITGNTYSTHKVIKQ